MALVDISFSDVASSATRGLLTWNRTDLLRTLSTSKTTLSNYVETALEKRKFIVKRLVQSAESKIAVSVDVCIEALQLQKSWLFHGVVDSGLIGLQSKCEDDNLVRKRLLAG